MGDPRPPLIQIPVAISDLQAVQFGRSIRLTWTLPKLNTDGSAATTIASVEIHRTTTDAAGPATLELKRFKENALKKDNISKEDFVKFLEGEKLVVSDTFSESEFRQLLQSRFHYAVKVLNQKNQDAGLSNVVSVTPYLIPSPPREVRSELAEKSIKLIWDCPVLNIDGSAVTGPPLFNIYRSLDGHSVGASLLNQAPVDENNFKDESAELDNTYYYFVRSLVKTASGIVESENSPLAEVINRDIYPPKPPTEVTSISNNQFISLVWLPNTESDFAGYWVYRAGADRSFRQLNDQLITTASTIDKTAEKGQTYFYRVRAVDLKGNQSDFSEEVSETMDQ